MITDAQGNSIRPFHTDAFEHRNVSGYPEDWTLVYRTERYTYWKHLCGYYNVSSNDLPPISDAGYGRLESLMQLKNETWWTIAKMQNKMELQ